MNRREVLVASAGLASRLACTLPLLQACSPIQAPMRLALNPWAGYALLFLAQDLGYLEESTCRLIEFPSNTAGMLALANGEVTLAALTLDELLQARESGVDLRVVMVFDESHGADMVMVRPDIQALESLRGRRIAVESTAVGALMLSRLLSAAGLDATDLVKVPLTADQHMDAYRKGLVDAVITFEPMASQLRGLGAHRLLDSSQFPGLIVDVLAVPAESLVQQGPAIRTLILAHERALNHLQAQPQDAARRLAPHLQITAQEVLNALQGIHLVNARDNHRWLSGPTPALMLSAQTVSQLMLESRLLRTRPHLASLCAPDFLPEPT